MAKSENTTKIIRAHRIRLNPTPEQEVFMRRCAGVARFTWNWALAEYKRQKALKQVVNWNQIKKEFRSRIDAEFPWVREVTASAPEQAIGDLRRAISTYYKAKKKNKDLRFPGMRKRKNGIGGFELSNIYFSISGHDVKFPKIGIVNAAESLRFDGKIMAGRVKERAGRWYIVITVQTEKPAPTTGTGIVGIDFGLSQFATLSTGEVYETQRRYRQAERHLRGLQRGLSRKVKKSSNFGKWKLKIARAHERVANLRSDFLHRFSTDIVRSYAAVCVEDLNLKGLARTRLAKSFADAGIGEAIRQLEYKTLWHGSVLQKVGRFYASSKTCSNCGYKNDKLTLSIRSWNCPDCGAAHDRDMNAARNIALEGGRLLAGSNHVGVTPVEGEALAWASAQVNPSPVEAGILVI